jgi:hypothetical protein
VVLIQCPGCGRDVSERAAACPQYGEPITGYGPSDLAATPEPSKKKSGCGGLAILIVLGIVGVMVIAAITGTQIARLTLSSGRQPVLSLT